MLALLLQQSRLQWSRKAPLQAIQQVSRTCALGLHAVMAKAAAITSDDMGCRLLKDTSLDDSP